MQIIIDLVGDDEDTILVKEINNDASKKENNKKEEAKTIPSLQLEIVEIS